LPQVINLLCNIATRAEQSVKDHIADCLYPPGQPRPYILDQVANLFGRALPPDKLVQAAEQVARFILLQVQRLPPGQESTPYRGRIGSVNAQLADGTLVVHFASFVELEAMSRNRRSLPPDSMALLVDAVLRMIRERENFLVNRAGLIYGLRNLG